MINKYTSGAQHCPICPNSLLENIGTELYCRICNRFNSHLQEEVRAVPQKYESNSKNKRELENQRKFNQLIREFSDKIRDLQSSSEIKLFRNRLALLKKLMPKKKGLRECAAVVVYCQMQEEIKMNIKDYCKSNNLNIKVFNQKYKIYMQRIKQQTSLKEQPFQYKVQQKIEEYEPTEKSQVVYEEYEESKQESYAPIEGVKRALEVIFDQVFQKYFFKQKKHMIINGLIHKIQDIDTSFLLQIKYYDNPPLKLYYLIYGVIKCLGHKIKYAQFSEIIKMKTGFSLKRKAVSQVKKAYEQMLKKKQNETLIKREEFFNEVPIAKQMNQDE